MHIYEKYIKIYPLPTYLKIKNSFDFNIPSRISGRRTKYVKILRNQRQSASNKITVTDMQKISHEVYFQAMIGFTSHRSRGHIAKEILKIEAAAAKFQTANQLFYNNYDY